MGISRKQRNERKLKQSASQIAKLTSDLAATKKAAASQEILVKYQGDIIRDFECWEKQVADIVGPESFILKEIARLEMDHFPEPLQLPDRGKPLVSPTQCCDPIARQAIKLNILHRLEVAIRFDRFRNSKVLLVTVRDEVYSAYYTDDALRFMPVEVLADQLARQIAAAMRATS